MPVRQLQATFDCSDPATLSRSRCEALGVPPVRNSSSACHDPGDLGPRVFFQQVPEGRSGRNRVRRNEPDPPLGPRADRGGGSRGRRVLP